MNKQSSPRIGIVYGGPSLEEEVSKVTAYEIDQTLRTCYSQVHLFELSPKLAHELVANNIEVVFPATHGGPGEDGTLQGLLEILGLPYVGCGVLASACSMDKITAKQLFKLAGLPVAPDLAVSAAEGAAEAARRVYQTLQDRVVVKPVLGGSGINTLFCDSEAELSQQLVQVFQRESRVLIEQFIHGKEITVGLLEVGDELQALPVIEIRTPEGTWYDYAHRYTQGWSEHLIPAPLSAIQYQRAQTIAKEAFRILQCRDLARADLIAPPEGDPVLLEVNTIPGMTPTSLYPEAAKAAGWEFPELLSYLIERAMKRDNLYAGATRKIAK